MLWLVMLAAMVGCPPPGPNAAQGELEMSEQDPRPVDERQRLLAELAPGVVVSVRLGVENFRSGEITLTVGGDGAVRVLQRKSGAERTFETTWPRDRLDALGAEFAALGFCDLTAIPGGRKPGDTPMRIALVKDGTAVCEADLWHGDRYKNQPLDALIKRYDAVVSEVSGGVLPFERPAP